MSFNSAAEPSLLRQIISISLVFALLAATLWKLSPRRFLNSRTLSLSRFLSWTRSKKPLETGVLRAVGRVALTPHHALHLIRIEGREILIATHPTGCNLLVEATAAERAAKGASA